MNIQGRKSELEDQLGKVKQEIKKLEDGLRNLAAMEQRMLGAITLCDEILNAPETKAEPETEA